MDWPNSVKEKIKLLFELEKQLHTFEVRSNKDKIFKLLSDDFLNSAHLEIYGLEMKF